MNDFTLSKSRCSLKRWLVALLTICPYFLFAQNFVHPGIPFTTDDLNQLKTNITIEPWKSAYNAFANDSRSKLNYGRQGPFKLVGRAPDLNNSQWRNDMQAVFNLSMMWVFTNDAAYAQKATDILNAWAITHKDYFGDESFLDIGDYAPRFVTGADILKATYPGWTAQNTENVRNYFNNVLWPELDVPNPVRGLNQGAIQLEAAVSIAAFLDDTLKWNQVIQAYRADAGGGLANSLSNGEVGDAGRDEGHWRGQIYALSWSAEVFWKQGIDMYAELDNRLLAITELYAKFMLDPTPIPFIPFGGSYAYYTNWGAGTGGRQNFLAFNIIESAYSLRKGIAAPYSTQYRNTVGENAETFFYRKTSDASTALPLPPIEHPSSIAFSNLTSIDVGNVGIEGSASFNNGTWNVYGAGERMPVPGSSGQENFHYAFRPIKNNAVIVTKINQDPGPGALTRGGIMIRESLDPTSKYVALLAQPDNNLNLTWKGAQAWSKTNVSWNNPPAGYLPHYAPSPRWLKLERIGSRITAFHSHDAISWTCIGAVEINMTSDAFAGLCVSSQNTSQLSGAEFSELQITPNALPGSPVVSSALNIDALLGQPIDYTITATGSPESYVASGLAPGLTLNPETGIITGTPTALGDFMVSISATNSSGTGAALLLMKIINNTAPAAPEELSAVESGPGRVTVSWEASSKATHYILRRALTAGGPYEIVASTITSGFFIDEDPFPGINYYVVTAATGELQSSPSGEIMIQLPPEIPVKPVVSNDGTDINITWLRAQGADSYNVKRSISKGGPYSVIASSLSDTMYIDQGGQQGTHYFYVVSSVKGAVESANSPEEFGVPGGSFSQWKPEAVSSDWNNPGNWVQTVPASPASLSFGNSNIKSLNNNLLELQTSRISFEPDTTAYTISGNELGLSVDVINKSVFTQTLQTPLKINQPVELIVDAGNMIFSGIISGNGSITKRGNQWLRLSGQNTYTGGTIIYNSQGGWPPNGMVLLSGTSTGTSGAPTAGPAGTGPIVMSGGAIHNDGSAYLLNTVVIKENTKSYIYARAGGLTFAGNMTGSGTVELDNDDYSGFSLAGNNSGFTGTFISRTRSSRQRMWFSNPQSGSANATWLLNSNFTDAHRFGTGGTYHFGSLEGTGLLNPYGGVELSIGALNKDAEFSGTIRPTDAKITKVGTGKLILSGPCTNFGGINVNNGTLLVNLPLGTVSSPVFVNAGTFGGNGSSSAAVTIGTGKGTPAYLAPGNGGIGEFTSTGALTMNGPATHLVELNSSLKTGDLMICAAVTLNNATLSLSDLSNVALPIGSVIPIIENTGNTVVNGIYNGVAEGTLLRVRQNVFKLSYAGGTGNDISLTVVPDPGPLKPIINSSKVSTGQVGKPFQYTITALNEPVSFQVSTLPNGLTLDPQTGVVSGTPTQYGVSTIELQAINAAGSSTITMTLTILTDNVPSAPAGITTTGISSTKVQLNWEITPTATSYTVKRSLVTGGPYTTIATNNTGNQYVDGGLGHNSTYYYTVSASNHIGEGPNSSEVSGTSLVPPLPSVPLGVSLTSGASGIYVSWNAASEATAYKVYRSQAEAGPYTLLNTGNTLMFNDVSVSSGIVYYYAISSLNMTGESALSPKVSGSANASANGYAYWPLDENTGSVATDVWSGKVGNKSTVGNWIQGVSGSAVDFAGNSSMTLPNGFVNGLNDFTISCWVKLNTRGIWSRVFDFGTGTNNYMFITPAHGNSGNGIRFAIRTPSVNEQVVNGPALPLNSWSHITITKTGKLAILYLNGVEVGRHTNMTLNPTSLGNTTLNYIGQSMFPADPRLNGAVDEFKVFSRGLTAAEVLMLIEKKNQSIVFTDFSSKWLGDPDFNLHAYATSGLPLSYTSTNPEVATVDLNGQVHINQPGNTTITISQAGNEKFASVNVSKSLTVHGYNITAEYKDGDQGRVNDNLIKPYLKIVNQDSVGISYSELTARYWLTAENFAGLNTWIDYATLGSAVKMKYVELATPKSGAYGYIEFSFLASAGILKPSSNSGPIQARAANSDWAILSEGNDYSYMTAPAYTLNSKITLYRNGVLISGNEPTEVSPEIKLKPLSLAKTDSPSTINTHLKIDHEGNIPVDFSDVTVRYWFTKEGNSPAKIWIDYAKLGASNIAGSFVSVTPVEKADIYLELKFTKPGKFYPSSSTGAIQYRIAKEDWSAFVQNNDHSYVAAPAFAANDYITIYHKNQLVWGIEPSAGSAATARTSLPEHSTITQSEEGEVSVSVYPNPASEEVFIGFANDLQSVHQLHLLDNAGRLVMEKLLSEKSTSISLSNIPAGLYFIHIQGEYNVQKKIMVVKN